MQSKCHWAQASDPATSGPGARSEGPRAGRRAVASGFRLITSGFLALFMMSTGACQQPVGPIFPAPAEALVWPDPPDRPRISYVGQLKSSADLKKRRAGFQRLTDMLVGQEQPDVLYGPQAILCSEDGMRLWIGDPGGRCLHLFDLKNRTYKKISLLDGSQYLSPIDLCHGPAGSIYVCDSENVAIHRLDGDTGALIETLRLEEDIRRPVALTYDSERKELFVVDVVDHNIKVLGPDGKIRRSIGRRGAGPGQFNFPCDIADGGDLIWVADTGNHRIQSLTKTGEPHSVFGRAGDALGEMALPKRIALDSNGYIYVVDSRFENVQIFEQSGRLLLFVGEEGSGPGQFWLPSGIFVGEDGRIWVCDTYNRRIQVFEYINRAEETNGVTP